MRQQFKIQDSRLKIPCSIRESLIFNFKSSMNSKAFTLLEVLISLAIVSITLVVLIHSQLLSLREGTHSQYYTTAVFLGSEKPQFPYIALVASGGHSSIFRVTAPDDYILQGRTRDDAAGEAFDKVSKI